MIYKNIIYVILFIILCSYCFAASPFVPTQVSSKETQLDILYPKITYLQINKDYEFNIHVFNFTGFIKDNTSTDCFIHLYNSSGEHLFKEELLYDGMDFYLNIGGNNFSKIGEYPFNVWCNNSVAGGFASGEFFVTKSGYQNENNYLNIGLILMFVIGFMFFLGYNFRLVYFDYETKDQDGQTKQHNYPVLMYLFWLIGGWLIAALINVAIAASTNLSVNLENTMATTYSAVVWVLYILTALFIVGIAFYALQWLGKQTERLK